MQYGSGPEDLEAVKGPRRDDRANVEDSTLINTEALRL
ncbi:hypothetical protein PABG_11678 [Paracoccidioides brasiliensis Pb03]|nr:hypothetical protein PABG_11678 [Paracoccidioides brasiliensis Pb03]